MKPVSLSRFLIEEQRDKAQIRPDLRLLIEVVARACKSISIAVGKGALGGVLGDAGATNIQGEAQKKLDVLSNEILLEANEWGGHLAAIASEEMDDPHPIPHRYPKGEYLLVFDPLDGSSNIDVNVSVGTIFSVLRCPEGVTEPTEAAWWAVSCSRGAACASRRRPPSSRSTPPTSATGRHRCSATWRNSPPARPGRAGATSTCAGWPRWWPTCTAS